MAESGRHGVRLCLTRPVPLDLVKECIEVALQAPNGGMREGWHWIVVTEPQVRAQIGDFYRRSTESYLSNAAATTLHLRYETEIALADVLHVDRW